MKKYTKTIVLTSLLILCVAGMIISSPFSMKVKTVASDFQVEASTRYEQKMSLFKAMNELETEKALWDSGAVTAEDDVPQPDIEDPVIGQNLWNYRKLLRKTAKNFPSRDIPMFKIRLILFLVFIIAFIVFVALLKKIRYLLLAIGAIFMIFPFYWMVTGSLKELKETTGIPTFTPNNWLNFQNYKDAWTKSTQPFSVYYINSIIVCVASVLCVLITTVLAAYAFARLKFPGRDIIFTLLLSMMMIPFELLVITNQQTIVRLGMKDELISLVVPFISSIFYTYILRNFFMSVPESLYNAATVDGCSNWGYLWKVMFPIAKPSLVTILLLNALSSWNSFMWPQLVISNSAKRTLPWALIQFKTDVNSKENMLMAAATMTVLPMLIMFLFARKQIVSGVSRGGIKG